MQNAAGDPLVGKTVAQYEVVARLGGGGMGIVYAARDIKLGRRVALKFLPPQWCHDEAAKQRFIREAQAASSTDHRNICTIHDIGCADDGQLFIVMAHYGGVTLKDRLESGPLTVDEAIEIAAQVAEGLAKAHTQGVVHRDIKPGNLMLTEDGVKILDFGLAKLAESGLKLTLEGATTIGTISYMSPEQARGEDADPRSDVWAIGVVLYEMLAGAPPFGGLYPEAIAHAIKTDPPAPLRRPGREIPESLEQVVFRALHKNPAVRFQSARDLARALRQLQGRTLPLDLRTEPVPVRASIPAAALPRRARWWTRRPAVGAALAAAIVLAGGPLWIFAPVDRVPVAVAPVVNQTGYAELDAYRLAFTRELVAQLGDAPTVRVLPYERLVQIVRRFRAAGQDVSSREAIRAIAEESGAAMIVVPTLLYEDNAWRARVEVLDAATATTRATVDTDAAVSALAKDTTYRLVPPLTQRISAYFLESAPLRVRAAQAIRRLAGADPAVFATHLSTLDAAAAFEAGLDAYDQQEHTAALRAFTAAADMDTTSALASAWRSRVARLMRHDQEAADAGTRAAGLLTAGTPTAERLFVEAVAAEARRDFETAERRYQDLASEREGELQPLMELAGFLDRRQRTADAIETYHEALRVDSRQARAHLELCRLYGPIGLNDTASARMHGTTALERYRALGARAGEAQAMWCLTDVLALQGPEQRAEAARHAGAALTIFEGLGYQYNLSRAYNYAAIAATRQGRLADAATWWERSLTAAEGAGNAGLAPQVLTNLGSIYTDLGNPARAVEYRRRGYTLFEALGDEQRAAQNQANGAELTIRYGVDAEPALRDLQNALAVFQKLGDKYFEATCRNVIGAYYRRAGDYTNAELELNRALAIARERNITDRLFASTIDLAASKFDQGAYAAALELVRPVAGRATGRIQTEALILEARTLTRTDDLQAAAGALSRIDAGTDSAALMPYLHLVRGEHAHAAGDLAAARTHFESGAALWRDEWPDPASIEARVMLGLIDALQGRVAAGRARVAAMLAHPGVTSRFALNARARLVLARIEEMRGRA